jgi:N-acetylglutamate synthase
MILTIEELSANAWPALQTVLYDGWILRFANGYTRRANSVLPLYPSRLPPEEKIGWCEDLYHQRLLPAIFKLAGRNEARQLNGLLLELGYHAEADTSVQMVELRGFSDEIAPDIRLTTVLTAEWEASFGSMSGLREDQQAKHAQILAAILPRKCYASVRVDGQTIGCGLGVLQNGHLGIFDVVIHPSYRGKGHGERLMRSLLVWGRRQNAHSAYLQVMLNNSAALRLYDRLGFKEQYQYWYCVKEIRLKTNE